MLAVATTQNTPHFLFLEQRMSVKAHQPSVTLVLAVDPAVRTKAQLCQK